MRAGGLVGSKCVWGGPLAAMACLLLGVGISECSVTAYGADCVRLLDRMTRRCTVSSSMARCALQRGVCDQQLCFDLSLRLLLQTNGQYYSVHGKTADRIARLYYSTSGVIKDSLGLRYLTCAQASPIARPPCPPHASSPAP